MKNQILCVSTPLRTLTDKTPLNPVDQRPAFGTALGFLTSCLTGLLHLSDLAPCLPRVQCTTGSGAFIRTQTSPRHLAHMPAPLRAPSSFMPRQQNPGHAHVFLTQDSSTWIRGLFSTPMWKKKTPFSISPPPVEIPRQDCLYLKNLKIPGNSR